MKRLVYAIKRKNNLPGEFSSCSEGLPSHSHLEEQPLHPHDKTLQLPDLNLASKHIEF